MCNRLTKLSVTMWYTFFGIFDDTSLWILPKTHDPSLCDTPDESLWFNIKTPLFQMFIPTFDTWANCSKNLVRVHKIYRPRAQMANENVGLIQSMMYEMC